VIVVLALLAAAFLPRVLRTEEEAFAARMRGLQGALREAVMLYHAAWRVAQNDGAVANLDRHGLGELDANAYGFPVSGRRDAAAAGRDRDCEDVWRGLLNPAPSVVEADPTKEIGNTVHHIEPKLGTGIEFVAGQDGSIPDSTLPVSFVSNAEVCQFISLHYQSVAPGAPKPTLFYDTRTGEVYLDLDRVF